MVLLIAIATVAALIVVNVLLSGWVLSVLWGWFIVPTFGLPQLGIGTAVGLALVVRYLTSQTIDCEDKRSAEDKVMTLAARLILTPLLALIFGWLVHTFM